MSRATWFALFIVAGTLGVIGVLMYSFTPQWLIALGDGIAQAEGFGIPGAIPTTHNNPGDITDGSGNKLQFATVSEGFAALYRNVMGAFTGVSTYYSPGMTIAQFAQTWTGGDQADSWAATVLAVVNAKLGTSLTPDNTLQDLAGAAV